MISVRVRLFYIVIVINKVFELSRTCFAEKIVADYVNNEIDDDVRFTFYPTALFPTKNRSKDLFYIIFLTQVTRHCKLIYHYVHR